MKKKILFFAPEGAIFLKPVIDELVKTNKYDIGVFEKGNPQLFWDLFRNADIVWFEWCNDNVVTISQMPQAPKIIVRLHSYEAFTPIPSKVNWSNVDLLVFVNETVREIIKKQVPLPLTTIIPNAVDIDKFPFKSKKEYGKRVGYAGYINYKKNPQLLLYLFQEIYKWDKEFRFYIKGDHQDPRIKIYWDNLLGKMNIPILVEPFGKDINKWYERMDYIVSPSLFESFNYVIAEGMLTGCIPLIHSWYGSDLLYPKKYIWNFIDEAIEIVKSTFGKQKELAISNREFIIKNYSVKNIIKKYIEIFDIL